MHKLLLALINPVLPLVIYIVGCNTNNNAKRPNGVDTIKAQATYANNNTFTVSFSKTLKNIKAEKEKVKTYYKNNPTANYNYAKKQFLYLFEHHLLPQWMGTKWDFNGTTQQPQQGAIACGYFVSTTLLQMQFPINRIKYGQAASEITMLHLTNKNYYKIYSNLTYNNFINTLKAQKPFLAIVGLDKHTGYLLNNGKELYFIHSTYVNRKGVVKQIAAQSAELKSNKWRSVAFLTNDESFLQKWLKN